MPVHPTKFFAVIFPSLAATLALAVVLAHPAREARASSANSRGGEPAWRVAPAVTYKNLAIFPVLSSQQADTTDFVTLDEALASGEALVTEEGSYLRRSRDGSPVPAIYFGPQVNQLVLVNRGKRPLLLLAGEVVSGGKQDRIIGKDRIVPVGAQPLPLDVFCVEHGRWTGASDQFAEAKTMVHPTVREKAAVEQDQSEVWDAVTGQAAPVGSNGASAGGSIGAVARVAPAPLAGQSLSRVIASSAPTQSYLKIYQSPAVAVSVEDFAQELQRRFSLATSGLKGERVVGVVVAFGGEIVWSDVFASSDLFEAYWPKLLRSYVVEALTRPAAVEKASLDDARDFLRLATGHVREDSEPGVYIWREQSEGRFAEIQIVALQPRPLTLHWLRVERSY
jgi:hypothetical protein